MAKVEIEDRAFSEPRLDSASARFKVSRAVIIGYAAILWRKSQQAGAIEATREDILAWLDADRFSKPRLAIEWLIAADFLRPVDADSERFAIAGNSIAVPRTQKKIFDSREAARKRWDNGKKRHNSASAENDSIVSCDTHCDGIATGNALAMPDIETCRHVDIENKKHVASKPRRASPKFSPWDLETAQSLQKQIADANPNAVKVQRANLESWANDIRLMREADGLSENAIRNVIAWVFADKFWGGVIQSAGNLRDKWDTITAQINRPAKKPQANGAWDIPQDRANVVPYAPRKGDIVAG